MLPLFAGGAVQSDRLRFIYLGAAREAAEWGADLYFSAGELAPLRTACPMIASFRNPNVFAWGKGQKLLYRQRVRVSALYGLARLSAARADRVMFVSEDSARWIGDSVGPTTSRSAPPTVTVLPTSSGSPPNNACQTR